jgi:hypothetical protein
MAAADPRWRGVLAAAAVTLAVGTAIVAGRVAWFDAYRLHRENPPWLVASGGANRLLDRQTRRAKALQAMTRDYSLALIGSSTVYHGLDPAEIDARPPGQALNLGISALRASELPVMAAIVASRPKVEEVVIGLDYYMFSRAGGPAPLNPALATPSGRVNALLGAYLSEEAWRDSSLARVTGGTDPGGWTFAGFRATPPLPPEATRLHDETRRRTMAPFRPETLPALREALERLRGRRVQVYLAPVSAAQRRVMADAGLEHDLARWGAEVERVAAAAGAAFHDLTALGADDPFSPQTGSTQAWLDNLHFTPMIGRQVLHRVGLRLQKQKRAL